VGEALGPHPGEGGQTLVLWYDNEYKECDVRESTKGKTIQRKPGSLRVILKMAASPQA
jgi:hypothetical protein